MRAWAMKSIRASVPAACEACGEAGERACVLRGCEGWRGTGRGTYVRPKGDQPCVRAGRARAVYTCTGCDSGRGPASERHARSRVRAHVNMRMRASGSCSWALAGIAAGPRRTRAGHFHWGNGCRHHRRLHSLWHVLFIARVWWVGVSNLARARLLLSPQPLAQPSGVL